VLPKGTWQLRTFVAFAAFCAACGVARAQSEPLPERDDALEGSPQPTPEQSAALDAAVEAPIAIETPEEALSAESPAREEAPTETSAAVEPIEHGAIRNAGIQEMAAAQFSDSTIIAVIDANAVEFDLSPRALVALKSAGVAEPVIEAMLAAAAEDKRPAEQELAPAQPVEAQASVDYAKLTEMIEQLAERQDAAEKARRAPEPPVSRADPTPRVWLVEVGERAAVAPTIAQVAFAGGSGKRERMKNLQGLANQALAFASPAVSGIATTLGSLFRPNEERTAVWALASPQSARVLDVAPVFEIDYAHIPGVDPEKYQPAIVQLVPTDDNYRLVAAAETDGTNARAVPRGPIIEETVETASTRLDRGRYRVAPEGELGPGEYALVLRPKPETGRKRGRDKEASLGELLGGSTSQILYLTWEFAIAGQAVASAF
jgi:hypothetical protein